MRSFISLSLLLAVVSADKLTYNYQPVAHSDNGLSFTPGGTGSSAGGYETPSNEYLAPSIGGESYAAFSSSSSSYNTPTELEKEFYTFAAQESDFEDSNALQRALVSVKQGLRVVFIKGPENKGFEDAALALAKQASQQKTAIYVLNKQADIGDLVNKLNGAGKSANTKPDVHFVKYRTAEDAANAQRAIQSQYDSLGGSSKAINGGSAPVLNFASQSVIPGVTPQLPKNAYLPTSVFRFRY